MTNALLLNSILGRNLEHWITETFTKEKYKIINAASATPAITILS